MELELEEVPPWLELEELLPIPELGRVEEPDGLEPVASRPEDDVPLFCAMAVAAISAQKNEVLSKTFFITIVFSFLLISPYR